MDYIENQFKPLPDFDLRILAIDTALQTSGYAVYSVSTGNFSFFLHFFGTIKTDSDACVSNDVDTRVRFILDNVRELQKRYAINFILPEEPSQTLYGSRIPNVLIGRAASVMKLMAATYGIIGWCHANDICCRTLHPTTWQHSLFGALKKGASKRTSIRHANRILKMLGYTTVLKTEEEENIADAINIGFEAVKRFKSRQWELPSFIK